MNNRVFFGDSNVNIFEYFKKFGAKVIKFKGAPIKGLVNKNDNYMKIVDIIARKKPTVIVMIFGIVDINFYYYRKKYIENNLDIFENMKSYVKDYVKIVSELNVVDKYIIGILPSIIKDKYFRSSLEHYIGLSPEIAKSIPDEYIMMVGRNQRTEIINNILAMECKKYNINFCNIFPYITKNYKTISLFSLGEYSNYNIHPKYEYILIVMIAKCLTFLVDHIDVRIMINDLKSMFNEYIKSRIYFQLPDRRKTNEEKDSLYRATKFSRKKILKFLKKQGLSIGAI